MYYHDEANVHVEEANVEVDAFQQAGMEDGNADMSGGNIEG